MKYRFVNSKEARRENRVRNRLKLKPFSGFKHYLQYPNVKSK